MLSLTVDLFSMILALTSYACETEVTVHEETRFLPTAFPIAEISSLESLAEEHLTFAKLISFNSFDL